ncbi:MAG TPA: glycosyltransferase family 9 protein [Candidatus Omnitrophota bacterium]|nr:glycosyltransferase family 9 protein [Candidatus Omnitrophota bacterium]HPS19561.1 glycosyltransferase family 9 protein [Candidatus Omnitrophota bacterium]
MKKILIANIFGIGDVLFTTPLLANLKKAFPDAAVDYMCNARTCQILRNDPLINKVFVYEKDEYAEMWKRSKTEFFKRIFASLSEIKGNRYDAVFDFTLSREFNVFFFAAGIKKRIGFDYKRRGLFLTHKMRIPCFAGRHVIEHYLDLLKYAGVDPEIRNMRISVNKAAEEWADAYFAAHGLDGKKTVAVIPGGGASWGGHAGRKRWGSDKFACVADDLVQNSYQVAVFGDAKEKEICDEVVAVMRHKGIPVETGMDINKYIAVLNKCRLVLCNDGGPLHIAVALGKSTVSLFGPVDPNVYGPYPWDGNHVVVTKGGLECRPCYSNFRLPQCDKDMMCLNGIDPDLVAEEVKRLLKVHAAGK